MKQKISKPQRRALEVLKEAGGWRGAMPGLRLDVLYALLNRRLVENKINIIGGTAYAPKYRLQWRLTKAGRQMIGEGHE